MNHPAYFTGDIARLTNRRLRILACATDLADADGWCRIGARKIADLIGVDVKTVTPELNNLSHFGFLEKRRVPIGNRMSITHCRVTPRAHAARRAFAETLLRPPGTAAVPLLREVV